MPSITSNVVAFPAHAIKCPPGSLALHPDYCGQVLVVGASGAMRTIRVEEHIADLVPNIEGLSEEEAAEVLCSETILTFEIEVALCELRQLRPVRDVGQFPGRSRLGLGLFPDDDIVIPDVAPGPSKKRCFALIDGGK